MPTVVKVQKPLGGNDADLWLVYDQLRARECTIYGKDIPKHVQKTMENHYKYFFLAEWNQEEQTWSLLTATHWRQW